MKKQFINPISSSSYVGLPQIRLERAQRKNNKTKSAEIEKTMVEASTRVLLSGANAAAMPKLKIKKKLKYKKAEMYKHKLQMRKTLLKEPGWSYDEG